MHQPEPRFDPEVESAFQELHGAVNWRHSGVGNSVVVMRMSKREEADIVEQLLDAADGIATTRRVDLAALLRRAALEIAAFRDLGRIREQLMGDDKAA